MSELTKEERLARALSLSQAEENVQEEPSKPLTKEERLARALELSQAEDKKKSQSQSVSSTEESSSGTSATKKEQSSGTTKPLSLEEKKALARGQKLGQLEEKKQESKLALERKQKSTNINWDVDKETEQAFKGVATKEEKMAQAKQEAMSVGETYVPNIEEKARAKEIQEAKPEQDLQRRLNLIPKEDLKSIFEGDNELTMFDGGQRLAEKYKLTDEEIDKAKSKYLEETVKEFKRKDLESSLDLIGKYAPAPKDFKDVTAYTQNIELLNKAKEMNFEKNKNLSFSLMGLEDNDRKVVDEYSSVMDRLNAYKEKSFMQQKQGADETGKGSMVINPKEIAQFEKDLKESQRLSKEIDKIRGNNNKLFDQYANVINKETGKTVTQESFTSKYENDYMKLKGALTDATYKLNYLEKEARGIREAERKGGRMLTDAQLNKQNAKLSNLDRERNLAKAEVLALSNALFLNEDITKKAIKPDETKIEKTLNVFRDLSQGYSDAILGEFNMTSTSEKNQARMLNEKLKEVGINLKDVDKQLEPTISEKFGGVLGTTTILGAQIAGTSILTGGAGTLARGAGMLPKVFAMYDKGGKFKKIADVIISGVNFELASEETSFAMGSAEEAAQLVFNKVTGKLKPLNPIINFFTKSLIGATGITVEEYTGDLFHEFTKTGISQETLDNTFGKSKEEGLEKFALTFTMGMMSMGKNAKVLLVGSYKKAKEVNPNSETVKAMESVMSEMGVDPDDVIAQLKAEAQTKSDRLYPDGKGGQLSASNMTVEQEIVLREKLGYKPLTEEELDIKRTVQEQEELAPVDSPYVTKKEMDDDLKVLKGEDEGKLPETYVGESVRTEEGIVTTVTEKVEDGTQLRVPTEQLVTDEAKPVAETFDRKKAGVIDVWQDPETNELFVINGTKRVATAMEDGVASVDVNFVKANSLEEAQKIGDLKNKLEDTDKTIDAVELVKANPTLKENLDLSKPKEAELYGLASLNESLTEELKSNPNQAGVLSIIGNNVSTEKQSEVYQFAKDNNLGKDEVAQLVKEPNLKEEGLADKVKIKTEQSKTGQSNIDALSKDATQLGMEPETLYDRVLSNSPTVKALTEKYAKGVASGLYSTTEATNRLNAEIKENLDAIKKEAGLDEAKKEVAQLESALTSDKKTSSDVLRDIASKIDKIADKMSNNTYSTIFGVEPLIAKAFLKTLSATLKTSATFMDGFNKAIAKFKNSSLLKGKTAQEINDIVAQLTKATTDIKQIADLKNPITKLQQSKVKQAVEARIKYLYQNSMNTLPTQNSIEKIAEKSGIIDYKTFAENVYRRLNKLEQSRAKRMETFEGAVSDFITKGGGSIKSLFNQLSTLILKDKQQATILRNIFLNAMSGVTTKGVKFTTSQVSSITNAFQKANLNNLSGIYDLTQQIEQIVTKAVDFKVNEDINSLQKAIKKFKNIPKKQLMVFQTLANIEANHLTATTKTELLNALEDIKSYLSGSSNLSYNDSQLNSIIKKAETESENYTNDKRKALIQKRYEEYKKNNPNTTLSEKEYIDMIMLPEEQRAKERNIQNRGIKRDEKRADLEKLTEENIDELFNYKIGSSTSSAGKTVLEIDTFNKILIPALRKLIDTGELKNLSDIQLKEINQLHSELMNFDSLAKLGFVANQMSGVLKANENKQLIKDSFREFSNVIKSVLTPNKGKYQGLTLGQAFKRIFVGSTGQKISAEIISKVNVGINLAKTEYKKFNKNFEEALKFEVSSSENYDLGAKAYFLTSPKGLSEIDAQLLFENKKEKLQRDIDELRRISQSKDSSRNKKKSAEIRAKQYQESLDFINKFDTYEDYVNAYNNGEVFSEKQQRVFDLAKNEYEKQKPMLIASNILFNGNAFIEEDYYTSTSYLKNEVGAKADKSVAEEAFNNLNVIRDPQSGTVFKKVNPASVGTDKILDFDFTGVTQSRVLENYYDMFTRGSVIELDALLQAESFYENFKDKNMTETYSYLYQRIANWINNETSVQQSKLDNSRSLSKKTTDVLSNIKKSILNTTGQVVKQPTVLFHTLSRFGAKDFIQGLFFYANNLASEKGRDKIRQLLDGSDVRNRAPLGDEQIAQSLNRQKSFALTDSGTYRFLQKLYSEPLRMIPGFKDSKVASAISLQKALNIGDAAMVYSDIMAAQLTYITAMINQQKKEGYDVKSIDDLIFNKNEKNTHIADMLSAEINNESATSKQGNLFSGKDNKILANLFFMFQSHASNASHAASNALLDMFETNKNVTVEDRFNGVKAIVGFTSAIITFRAISEIVKLLYAQIYETAADEIGYEDPRDEEEKDRLKLLNDKQFLEEASYRIGINAFTDIFFGGKFPSPVKDATVFGANTLFENLHLKYVDEEYEGRLPYSSNPMEYSGVIGAGTDFISDAYKVMSPPLDNVERDDILREMALETLIRQQYESYKNDKQGAFIDGLYTMFKLSGKGEPAKMMQMLQKQRERGFKEEDEKRIGVLDLLFEKRK